MEKEVKLARRFVRKFNTNNPFQICEALDITILFVPLCGVRGFYQYSMRNHIIYIDENLEEHEQLWVCAHELGHAMLHKESNAIFLDSKTYQNLGRWEREANDFAAWLLCPTDEEVSDCDWSLEQISMVSGVPLEFVERRFCSQRTRTVPVQSRRRGTFPREMTSTRDH